VPTVQFEDFLIGKQQVNSLPFPCHTLKLEDYNVYKQYFKQLKVPTFLLIPPYQELRYISCNNLEQILSA
jgi:hypothetical protein